MTEMENRNDNVEGGVAAAATCSPVVVIDGVRYVPENQEPVPDRASFWYMHDNHTFSRLTGTVEEIVAAAREWAKKSPWGMLCPVTLLRGEKEIRRLKKCVHAQRELGDTTEWEAEVRSDADVMRILSENSINRPLYSRYFSRYPKLRAPTTKPDFARQVKSLRIFFTESKHL